MGFMHIHPFFHSPVLFLRDFFHSPFFLQRLFKIFFAVDLAGIEPASENQFPVLLLS